ncbi:MAG TPA: cupin domain-containing protein [Nocardioidaceae bacterium]|nr:cupin domain-containing protein [Nocardioidaceae bacterium]
MTFHDQGYALAAGTALEDLDMGGGSVLSLKLTGDQSRGLVTVLEGVLESGGPPLHVHDEEDEAIVVLEGEVAYRVGDEQGTLTAGGFLWFPRQVPHAIANLSGSRARFLTIATPSGVEDFFRAQRDYLTSLPADTPPDPAVLGSVAGSETRRVVGPPLG